ncbi:MAG: hypothetical protein GY826_37860, partial [Fuerstiella sp.]|nr:hypothetical protein [Fuerstiella sp.]
MSSETLTDNSEVFQMLDGYRRRIACHVFLRGVATLLIAVVAYLVAAVLLDYLIGLPSTIRAILLVSFFLVCGWVGWKFMIAPMMTSVSETEIGAAIDLSCPDLHEGLATLISIERPEASVGEAGSAVMRGHLREQVAAHLG